MRRIGIGRLVEHLACSPGPVYAHALPADDWPALVLDLETRSAAYVAIAIRAEDVRAVVVFAAETFSVRRPVKVLAALTGTRDRHAGRLDPSDAAGRLLATAHAAEAGPATLGGLWAAVNAGAVEGNTRGIYRGGK